MSERSFPQLCEATLRGNFANSDTLARGSEREAELLSIHTGYHASEIMGGAREPIVGTSATRRTIQVA